jgi:biotin operon repressor
MKKQRTSEDKVLSALRKRYRVTRKTAIERNLSENITATIARLRQRGYDIDTVTARTPEGSTYTRYRLVDEPQLNVI